MSDYLMLNLIFIQEPVYLMKDSQARTGDDASGRILDKLMERKDKRKCCTVINAKEMKSQYGKFLLFFNVMPSCALIC